MADVSSPQKRAADLFDELTRNGVTIDSTMSALQHHAVEAYDRLMADVAATNREERLANIEALIGGPENLLILLSLRAEREARRREKDDAP